MVSCERTGKFLIREQALATSLPKPPRAILGHYAVAKFADVFCPAVGPNQCALSRPSAGDELARIFTTAAIGFGAETIVPIIFPGTPGCFESRAGMAASCFEHPRREVQRKAERRRIVSVSKSSWLGGPVVFCELLTSRGRNRNEGYAPRPWQLRSARDSAC